MFQGKALTLHCIREINNMNTNNTKSAVIYARVSSVGDRQNTERQVKDLTTYAQAMQMQVMRVFEEKISGAKKNTERPTLEAALDYCITEQADMLLVSELSRLGRNAFEVLETVKRLIDCGINLYMQKEQFTLLNDAGEPSMFAPVMLATLSTCAQLERDNITFRLQSGYKNFRAKGGKVGRKIGYRKTLADYEAEHADLVRDLRKKMKENLRGDKYSVRYLAKEHGCDPTTVQAITRLLKAE